MNTLRRYTFKTISNLVLSPRDHQGFYRAAGDFDDFDDLVDLDDFKDSKINIIYPFYQYGTYEKYDPKNTDYYIPGSSIKGAIGSIDKSEKLMIDDISVNKEDIKLNKLYKVQNLWAETDKQIEYKEFFNNLAVEMLVAEKKYEGEMYSAKNPDTYLQGAETRTKKRLKQLQSKITEIDKRVKSKNCETVLKELKYNIEDIISRINQKNNTSTYTILLGGYKGLLLSEIFDTETVRSAIFVDNEQKLPHGLVQITLELSAL